MRRMGERFRALRLAARMPQAALAARSGVAPSTIGGIENGQKRTREATLRRLCAAMARANPNLGTADAMCTELVELAGEALAAPRPDQAAVEAWRDAQVESLQDAWRRFDALTSEADGRADA